MAFVYIQDSVCKQDYITATAVDFDGIITAVLESGNHTDTGIDTVRIAVNGESLDKLIETLCNIRDKNQ